MLYEKIVSVVMVVLLVVGAGCITSNSGPSTAPLTSSNVSSTPVQNPSSVTTTSKPSNSEHVNFAPVEVNLSHRVHLEIDPRIELIQIIYHLSNVGWYREWVSPDLAGANASNYPYLRDVIDYFKNYTNTTAVRMVPEMVVNGLTFDAITEFALHLNPINFSKDMNWSDMLRLRP